MYTRSEISEALCRFAKWATEDSEIGRVTANMLEEGELEVIDIIDGEFVLRARRAESAERAA